MAGSSGHPQWGASRSSVKAPRQEGLRRRQPLLGGWCEGRNCIGSRGHHSPSIYSKPGGYEAIDLISSW